MKTLHILNGDATLSKFKGEHSPAGDTLVWRDILSEGPISATLPYQEFFAVRSKWISDAFKTALADYQKKVIDEFDRLGDTSCYDEIILWFEFDLHCQINMLFLLDFFSKKELGSTKIFLICPAFHPNHLDFRGIGQLSHEELAGLFPSRINIYPNTLAFAAKAWKAYCTGNKGVIRAFLEENFEQLPLLKPALKAHLKRLPDSAETISRFEQKLIDIVRTGITTRIAIYNEFWKGNPIYGMGDAEIDVYLDKLIERRLIPFIEPS